MAPQPVDVVTNYEFARLVWSAHILSLVSSHQNHVLTQPSLFDDDQEVVDRSFDPTSAWEKDKPALLDCLAESISGLRGSNVVTVIAVRENATEVFIDVVSNREPDSTEVLHTQDRPVETTDQSEDEELFEKLEQFFNAVSSRHPTSKEVSPRIGFRHFVLNRQLQRLAEIVTELEEEIGTIEKHVYSDLKSKAKMYGGVGYHLQRLRGVNARSQAEYTRKVKVPTLASDAHLALRHDAFISILNHCLPIHQAHKLFCLSRRLARPITACEMLENIAAAMPNKQIRMVPYHPTAAAQLDESLVVPIEQAWQQLNLPLLDEETRRCLVKLDNKFHGRCLRPLHVHAEVQLLCLYMRDPAMLPTFKYLGSSRKACLLCALLLYAVQPPLPRLKIRGSHDKCDPAWGIPSNFPDTLGMRLGLLAGRLAAMAQEAFLGQAGAESTTLSTMIG